MSRFQLLTDILEVLKDIDNDIKIFIKDYSNPKVTDELTKDEILEGIEADLSDIESPQESAGLEELEELLEYLYETFRADKYGESLPDEYLEIIKKLLE